jgi:Protein of unknown function (DUF3037)
MEIVDKPESGEKPENAKNFVYHIVRYSPSLVRDEWVNIGVLLFDEGTGAKRFRLIEEPEEFARVRRLHPQADEGVLRKFRDDLESRFEEFFVAPPLTAEGKINESPHWQQILGKWDDTLSNVIQLASPKGVVAADLDEEMERLYSDHVAPQAVAGRVGTPGSRATLRGYCGQVFRQAQVWSRLEKSVRAAPYTFPGDPMRIDYSYRRNGTRGFVQTLSVTRAPGDAKLLAYTAERITAKSDLGTEFAAVTDVPLLAKNERHQFVGDTLRSAGIEPVALEGFAVWVAKLKPLLGAQ